MTAGTAGVGIDSGESRAVLRLRGGGPSQWTWRGRRMLEGYGGPGEPDTPPLSANLILAPWPNRTRDGVYDFDGRRELTVTEPAKNTAIHGFVSDLEWTVTERHADSVRLSVEPGPQPGWPWPLHLSVLYRVEGDALEAHATLRNDGDSDMPAALGFHLYPSALGAATDDSTLSVPPHSVLPLDARGLPDGPLQADTSVLPDAVNPLAGRVLDHCLRLDDPVQGAPAPHAQDARFVLRGGAGEAVALTTSPELRWAQVFTPDASTGMPYPGRPGGRAVAVEPMTAPPDALNSGTGLARLPPGESLTCSWRLDVLAS